MLQLATFQIPASMRPPDLPGGNYAGDASHERRARCGFNEAAGFTPAETQNDTVFTGPDGRSFNEAAGFTRRKPEIAHYPRAR